MNENIIKSDFVFSEINPICVYVCTHTHTPHTQI